MTVTTLIELLKGFPASNPVLVRPVVGEPVLFPITVQYSPLTKCTIIWTQTFDPEEHEEIHDAHYPV